MPGKTPKPLQVDVAAALCDQMYQWIVSGQSDPRAHEGVNPEFSVKSAKDQWFQIIADDVGITKSQVYECWSDACTRVLRNPTQLYSHVICRLLDLSHEGGAEGVQANKLLGGIVQTAVPLLPERTDAQKVQAWERMLLRPDPHLKIALENVYGIVVGGGKPLLTQ